MLSSTTVGTPSAAFPTEIIAELEYQNLSGSAQAGGHQEALDDSGDAHGLVDVVFAQAAIDDGRFVRLYAGLAAAQASKNSSKSTRGVFGLAIHCIRSSAFFVS